MPKKGGGSKCIKRRTPPPEEFLVPQFIMVLTHCSIATGSGVTTDGSPLRLCWNLSTRLDNVKAWSLLPATGGRSAGDAADLASGMHRKVPACTLKQAPSLKSASWWVRPTGAVMKSMREQ